jgi:hypothetical protein
MRSGWEQVSKWVRTVDHTHRHIIARPRKRPGYRIHQLSRDSEIANLDDTLARQEDVRRLDIAMYNLLLMQIVQPTQDL